MRILSFSCKELRKFLESRAPAAWDDSFADDGVDRGDGSLGHVHDALDKSAIFQVSTWSLVDGKHMFEAIIFFKPLKNSSANGTALILSPPTKTHDKRENKNVSIMNSKELRGLVNTAKFLPGLLRTTVARSSSSRNAGATVQRLIRAAGGRAPVFSKSIDAGHDIDGTVLADFFFVFCMMWDGSPFAG